MEQVFTTMQYGRYLVFKSNKSFQSDKAKIKFTFSTVNPVSIRLLLL